MAAFIVGVTLVKGYETERDVRVDVGRKRGAWRLRFQVSRRHAATGAQLPRADRQRSKCARTGRLIETLRPEKRIYNASGQTMTIAAIATGFLGDRYVSLGEPLANDDIRGAWGVRIYLKPFVDWIWFGAFLMALGGLLAVSGSPLSARGDPEARLARRHRRGRLMRWPR